MESNTVHVCKISTMVNLVSIFKLFLDVTLSKINSTLTLKLLQVFILMKESLIYLNQFCLWILTKRMAFQKMQMTQNILNQCSPLNYHLNLWAKSTDVQQQTKINWVVFKSTILLLRKPKFWQVLCQQKIINVLQRQKTYSSSSKQSYKIWVGANLKLQVLIILG